VTGTIQVMELYVFLNPGENTVIVSTDGTSIPFIQIPEGAEDVSYQLAQGSSSLLNTENGFALLPGADKQYAIITTFNQVYSRRLEFTQSFNLPVSSATVIVPEGVKVRSDQLTDAGSQDSEGATYHLFQGDSLASGSSLSLTISGNPGDAPGFVLNQRSWIMIGVGSLGLVLIVLGIFLFVRDRNLSKLEEELGEEDTTEDSLGTDRESLMDAIIALDDQFQHGDISEDSYNKRRTELLDRLKTLS